MTPPPTATAIAEDTRTPTAIAVDADAVYWTNVGDDGIGAVARWSKATGASTILVDGRAAPFGLVASGGSLYWADTAEGHGAVTKIAASGGAPVPLATGGAPSGGLVVTGDVVAFVDGHSGGTLVRVPAAGGPKTEIARIDAVGPLAADGEAFFYLVDGVMKIPRAGGAASRVSDACFYPVALAVDDAQAYWGCQDGTLRAAPKAGGASRTLFSRGVGGGSIGGVALDADAVYFTSISDGAAMRVNKSGGDVTVVASGDAMAGPIAVDDAWVYYGTRAKSGANASVKRARKP